MRAQSWRVQVFTGKTVCSGTAPVNAAN